MAFILALLAVALIGGIPGVLIVRLLHRAGLARWSSLLFGNLIIPLAYVGAMTSGTFADVPNTPWWFLVVLFLGGVLFSVAYCRRIA